MLPHVMSNAPTITRGVAGSRSKKNDRMMVMTTLSLSTGATLDTSPSYKALK